MVTTSKQSVAAKEGQSLLALVQGGETPESVRALIGGHNDYRKKVRLHFDAAVAHRRRRGEGIRRNVDIKAISAELRSEIRRLLILGWNQQKIRETLDVGPWVIYKIGKQIDASGRKRGRGRRLSQEQKQEIVSRLKAGARSIDVAREFGIDPHTVWTFRHTLGGSGK